MNIEELGEETLIKFTHRNEILLQHDVQTVHDEIKKLISELGRYKLVLDFANIKILSSSAIAMMVSLNQRLKALNGHLILANMNSQIVSSLQTAHLHKILDIRADYEPRHRPTTSGNTLLEPVSEEKNASPNEFEALDKALQTAREMGVAVTGKMALCSAVESRDLTDLCQAIFAIADAVEVLAKKVSGNNSTSE